MPTIVMAFAVFGPKARRMRHQAAARPERSPRRYARAGHANMPPMVDGP